LLTQNPYQAYQTNQILLAKPEELTLHLYNGAIKFIQQAKMAMNKNEIEKTNELLLRVQDILMELITTLNMEYEVSHSLLQLYEYMKRRIIEANIKKDQSILQEAEEMLLELKQTWMQAMKQAKPF
jgi:flagellar protein FliS